MNILSGNAEIQYTHTLIYKKRCEEKNFFQFSRIKISKHQRAIITNFFQHYEKLVHT